MLSAMDNVAPSKTPARAIAQKQKRRASASPALGGSPAPGVVRAAAGGEVRSVHHFHAPQVEAVLGLRRLLVKIIGARDLPARRQVARADDLHEQPAQPEHRLHLRRVEVVHALSLIHI